MTAARNVDRGYGSETMVRRPAPLHLSLVALLSLTLAVACDKKSASTGSDSTKLP